MVEVRLAQENDLPAIHRVWWADGNSVGKNNPWFNHVLRTGTMVVAIEHDFVVGFAGHRQVWNTNVISDCYVDPERQGQGVGTQMLESLLPKRGEFMTLASQDPKAQALYRKWGMEPVTECLYLRAPPPESISPAREIDTYPLREVDLRHLTFDLGGRLVGTGKGSVGVVTEHSIESSRVGPDDSPIEVMAALLVAVGGVAEVQLSQAHQAYKAFAWEEIDRDTLMATRNAQVPDYERITFNGDLLEIG